MLQHSLWTRALVWLACYILVGRKIHGSVKCRKCVGLRQSYYPRGFFLCPLHSSTYPSPELLRDASWQACHHLHSIVPLCESTVPRVGHYTEANSCVLTCRNKERNKTSKHTSFIVRARSISKTLAEIEIHLRTPEVVLKCTCI
jgi:hypothetical protein